jgi:hypothetical protein
MQMRKGVAAPLPAYHAASSCADFAASSSSSNVADMLLCICRKGKGEVQERISVCTTPWQSSSELEAADNALSL